MGLAELLTKRLRLRAWTLEDAPGLHELSNDPSIADGTLTIPHPLPEGWAQNRIRQGLEVAEKGDFFPWAIALVTGEVIGSISFDIERRHLRGDLGYSIGLPYRGKGYATEAVLAVLEFAFNKQHLNRVSAGVFPRNLASARVLEKVGMTREGLMRAYVMKNNQPEDLVSYAILADDYAKRMAAHAVQTTLP